MKTLDLQGKTFGRLRVVRRDGSLSNGKSTISAWLCQCDCGSTTRVRGRDLESGNTESCGCLSEDRGGISNHPLHSIWADIKRRAHGTKSDKDRRFYAHVGICEEWERFEAFYQWALPLWGKGLDIDRKNTFGDYDPNNCRFITRKQNCQNTKRSRVWVVHGKQFQSSGDAARFFGYSQSHVYFLCCGRQRNGIVHHYDEPFCYSVRKYGNS